MTHEGHTKNNLSPNAAPTGRRLSEYFPKQSDDEAQEPEEISAAERRLIEWKISSQHNEKLNIFKYLGEDPTKMIVDFRPRAKGGEFKLPFGGSVTFPDSLFGKKDIITVCQVSPSERNQYLPKTGRDDNIISEVTLVVMPPKVFERASTLRLPYYGKIAELAMLLVYWRKTSWEEWESIEHILHSSEGEVEVLVRSTSMFCIVHHPKTESFVIPQQGVFHNVHLHHQVSLRVPKTATPMDLHCDIQIVYMPPALVADVKKKFSFEMADVVATSDIVNFVTKPEQNHFRWPVTVKLPFPHIDSEDFPHDNIAIMFYVPEVKGWRIMDTQLKFGKASVQFDTTRLGRFCVILLPDGGLKARLDNAMFRIEERFGTVKGTVLPFLLFQDALWTVIFEIVRADDEEPMRHQRRNQGFTLLKPATDLNKPVKKESLRRTSLVPSHHYNKPRQSVVGFQPESGYWMNLLEGTCFQVDVEGDLKADSSSVTNPQTGEILFYYNQRIPQNNKKIFLEPRDGRFIYNIQEARPLTGLVKLYRVIQDEPGVSQKEFLGGYNVEISAERMAKVLYVHPAPEPEYEPEIQIPVAIPSPDKHHPHHITPPSTPHIRRMSQATMLRLSTPRSMKQQIKDIKVLNGKSLHVLAQVVHKPMTLAAYLRIPDSTVTGMSFDALASGQSISEITYRMLLFWKRQNGIIRDDHATHLTDILKKSGEEQAAHLVLIGHRENRELTMQDLQDLLHDDDDEDESHVHHGRRSSQSGGSSRPSISGRSGSSTPHQHSGERRRSSVASGSTRSGEHPVGHHDPHPSSGKHRGSTHRSRSPSVDANTDIPLVVVDGNVVSDGTLKSALRRGSRDTDQATGRRPSVSPHPSPSPSSHRKGSVGSGHVSEARRRSSVSVPAKLRNLDADNASTASPTLTASSHNSKRSSVSVPAASKSRDHSLPTEQLAGTSGHPAKTDKTHASLPVSMGSRRPSSVAHNAPSSSKTPTPGPSHKQ